MWYELLQGHITESSVKSAQKYESCIRALDREHCDDRRKFDV